MERRVNRLQLFAYPSNRRFPWTTVGLFFASATVTAGTALCWSDVCRAESVEELKVRVTRFARLLHMCSATPDSVQNGEVHRFVLPSLLRGGEQPARVLADAVVLCACGTMLERLHGPIPVFGLVILASVLGNVLAPLFHQKVSDAQVSVTSTSGGVVALGVVCALRHSRWAAFPGVPVPVGWLLAPLVVADGSGVVEYFRWFSAAQTCSQKPDSCTEVPSDELVGDDVGHTSLTVDRTHLVPTGVELVIAMAAAEAVQTRARNAYRPELEDVAEWQESLLEAELERTPLPQPDCTFFADLVGVAVAVAFVVLRRM